jgi:hypothetical protein
MRAKHPLLFLSQRIHAVIWKQETIYILKGGLTMEKNDLIFQLRILMSRMQSASNISDEDRRKIDVSFICADLQEIIWALEAEKENEG